MLAIRLQRTGRKGHAQFRMIVQEARRSPNSGRVVETLGNYNPHTKETTIDKDKAKTYLSNGAQPSERVARILKADGVKLPSWVKIADNVKTATKNPDKLRKNRPAEPAAEVDEETVEAASEEVAAEAAASDEVKETPAEEKEGIEEESKPTDAEEK